MTPEEINHYNLNQGEIDITEVMNKHLYDKVVSKCNQLEEENKELVTKCNQLEKEKMAMQDTIEELNIMRCELEAEKVKEMSQKIERLEFDNDALEISRDELEKKLKIAITTLKHISCGRLKYPQGTAKRALLEIQEVK